MFPVPSREANPDNVGSVPTVAQPPRMPVASFVSPEPAPVLMLVPLLMKLRFDPACRVAAPVTNNVPAPVSVVIRCRPAANDIGSATVDAANELSLMPPLFSLTVLSGTPATVMPATVVAFSVMPLPLKLNEPADTSNVIPRTSGFAMSLTVASCVRLAKVNGAGKVGT